MCNLDNDEYAVGNNGNNEPLAEGDNDNNDEYTSAACCAESIILSVMPAESIILSALAEIIMLSVPPAESMILSVPPADVPSYSTADSHSILNQADQLGFDIPIQE
jgi:hypothetical protein